MKKWGTSEIINSLCSDEELDNFNKLIILASGGFINNSYFDNLERNFFDICLLLESWYELKEAEARQINKSSNKSVTNDPSKWGFTDEELEI